MCYRFEGVVASGRGKSVVSEVVAGPRGIIGLRDATKTFGGTTALRDVSFDLRAGEVLALLGENGAGKSTCVKLLAGVYPPSRGRVVIDGEPVAFASPLDAQQAGVAVMHQHPGLFPDLSVVENVFMGHMPRGLWGLDHAAMAREAEAVLASIGLPIDVEAKLGGLRTSEQQLVEIARALTLEARVLIMDEPTAALSQREVERLFDVVAACAAKGVAMMFVGHRMDEIFRIADRIAVLRDGLLVGVEPAAELSRDRAIGMMVGRQLSALYPHRAAAPGEVLLEVTRPDAGGASSATSASASAAARSSASAAWSAAAGPRSRGRSSASPGRRPARSAWPAPCAGSTAPARRWPPASPMSPRTVSGRAW